MAAAENQAKQWPTRHALLERAQSAEQALERTRREHEAMVIQAKDARAQTRKIAAERDAAIRRAEAAEARVLSDAHVKTIRAAISYGIGRWDDRFYRAALAELDAKYPEKP
jgi:myo-inositol catabolism protein IolC